MREAEAKLLGQNLHHSPFYSVCFPTPAFTCNRNVCGRERQGSTGAVVLNLWVATPLRELKDPFTGSAQQIACTSDIYIAICKSSKVTVMN